MATAHTKIDSKYGQGPVDVSLDGLRRAQKLILALDIDKTIVHASHREKMMGNGEWFDDKKFIDVTSYVHSRSKKRHYIKLRPELTEFLDSVSQRYVLWIYTHGDREYAEVVVKYIDPDNKYFGNSRILSKDDCQSGNLFHGDTYLKDLNIMLPGSGAMTVVMDDIPAAWESVDRPNVMQVKPYTFFLNTPMDHYNEKRKQQLRASQIVLADIHEKYYNNPTKPKPTANSVWSIMIDMRKSLLENCTIVFAGFDIPQVSGLTIDDVDQESWRSAWEMGAKCDGCITPSTTHIIALEYSDVTRIIDQMKKEGLNTEKVKFLSLDWLEDTLFYWKRQPESRYEYVEDSDSESS